MRRIHLEVASANARSQTDRDVFLPVDRHVFDRRALADLEQILSGGSTQDIEPTTFIDLAWNYFVAGFAAATQSETPQSIEQRPPTAQSQPARTPAEHTPPESIGDPLADMVAALSFRRLEVLRLAARGLTNREIAEILEISNHTVKSHMAALFESLDVTNRTEAAYALQCYEEIYPSEFSK